MSERWIIDASPLILLGQVEHLSLLERLAPELVIPASVADEVLAGPGGRRILSALEEVQVLPDLTPPGELEPWNLGPGELQVLAQALNVEQARAVVDDRAARRCAYALGVSSIGTLGIVLRAKRRGLIERARPILEQLTEAGLYLSEGLIKGALAKVGE